MGVKKIFPAKEGHGHQITIDLVDDEGAAVTLANISTAKLWLWNAEEALTDAAYINGREEQNVKGTNNVDIHATSGRLTWDMQPLDNPVRDANVTTELHHFFLEITHAQAGGVFWGHYGVRVTPKGLPA